jgi:hypothetical protein
MRGAISRTRVSRAMTYEEALREASSYLEIGDDDRDSEGTPWDIE